MHAGLVGHRRGRVRVEDHERGDRRVGLARQRRGQAAHVDRARARGRHALGAHDRVLVDAVVAGAHAQPAAAGMAEVAGDQRQRQDRADRLAGAVVALQPEPDADGRGPRGGDALAEAAHDLDLEPALLGGALDRPLAEPRLELRPADGVRLQPLAVGRAGVQHVAHQAEGEGGVGAGQRGDVLVAAARRVGADRIDGDDVRAPLLRLAHERPLVEVRGRQVRAPEDDQPRLDDRLRLEAHRAAVDRAHRGGRGGRADRGAQPRGAEVGEQARAHRPALHVAHGAGEVVGQDRLGAVTVEGRPAARPRPARCASSQVARRNEPAPTPLGPTRTSGKVRRSGPLTASR